MATSEPLEIQESLLKGFVHDHQSTYSSSEEELGQQRETSSSPSPFKRALPWLLHTIIFCVYTVVIFGYSSKPLKAFPTELQSVENFIKYEEKVFDNSALHPLAQHLTAYEGRPTPEKNVLWTDLWNVGMVPLTKEEADRLPSPTAKYHEDESQYVVTIAMFHQLHCIDRLRYVVWGNDNPMNETPVVSMKHTDHCIDYLRQVIMCHGDTTPMPMIRVLDKYGEIFYDTNWNVHHTCRNFDMLYDWATLHNTTDLHI